MLPVSLHKKERDRQKDVLVTCCLNGRQIYSTDIYNGHTLATLAIRLLKYFVMAFGFLFSLMIAISYERAPKN